MKAEEPPDDNDLARKDFRDDSERPGTVERVQDAWRQLPPEKRKGGRETWLRFIGENTGGKRDAEARDELIDWQDWDRE